MYLLYTQFYIKYDDFDNIDVVVIGSPTRAFSPTKDIVQLIKNMKKNVIFTSQFKYNYFYS